jgi:hypothetical protein
MTTRTDSGLGEAYDRLHQTGPEYGGWLSNHGPMAVEALVRRGHGEYVDHWLDRYSRRLDERPRPAARITEQSWPDALGDLRRLGDWPVWFAEQLREQPWTQVLATWWPRLLPGLAGGATHGVIRLGHVTRALRADGISAAGLGELAEALGYWAACWREVPRLTAPAGRLTPAVALERVATVPDQHGGFSARLGQLAASGQWPQSQAAASAPATPEDSEAYLRDVVTAAVRRYATRGHGNPIMLVHGATAPNAVLRTLPSLPRDQWVASAAAGWSATASIYAAYAPHAAITPPPAASASAAEAFARAAQHGDEHVIKFADTALDVFQWTGDQLALIAATRATDLIDRD